MREAAAAAEESDLSCVNMRLAGKRASHAQIDASSSSSSSSSSSARRSLSAIGLQLFVFKT
jgi:hypothetical protein